MYINIYAVTLCLLLIFLLLFSLLIALRKNRKLRKKYNLSVKNEARIQWRDLLCRKAITYNFDTFEEMEKLIAYNARYVPEQFLHAFKRCAQRQKKEYSNALSDIAQSADQLFIQASKERWPELSREERLLAFLIREQWDLEDIANILHISYDAAQKRRCRLKAKLVGTANKRTNFIEFLKSIAD